MDAGRTLTLVAEPLQSASFAPFGRVLPRPVGTAVNEGRGVRIDLGAALVHDTAAASPTVALYRMEPSPIPVPVSLLERHPRTEQLFAPVGDAEFLVVVAPHGSGGAPDPSGARAFLGRGDQQIVYAAGVWHFPMVALARASDFLMAMWETGGPDDCQSIALPSPVRVILP